jgi:hypothetical protein
MNTVNMHLPAQAPANDIRETLFGDLPLSYWGANKPAAEPWASFARAKALTESGDDPEAAGALLEIVRTPGLESRHYLQAHHFIRQLGYRLQGEKELLGVVVEVAMPEGLDLLAVYEDYTARYYNYSGTGAVWERPNAFLDEEISQVLQAGQAIMERIGPWAGPRPDAPQEGNARINLLTSDGLHFGEGPMHLLMKDPLGGALLKASLGLIERLMDVVG